MKRSVRVMMTRAMLYQKGIHSQALTTAWNVYVTKTTKKVVRRVKTAACGVLGLHGAHVLRLAVVANATGTGNQVVMDVMNSTNQVKQNRVMKTRANHV